ncbi:MAG: hypothetical protein AAGA90_09235 [Actinomycetota bacterium]
MTGGDAHTSVWHEFFHHPVGGFVLGIIPNVGSASTKKWFLSTVGSPAADADISVSPWRPYRLSSRPEPEAIVHRLPTFAAIRDPRSRLASVYITRMIRPPVDRLSPTMRRLIETISGVEVTPDHPRLSYRQFADGLAAWADDDTLELHLRPQAAFLAAAGPRAQVCRLDALDALLAGLSTRAGRPRATAGARRSAQPVSSVRNGVADRSAGEWRRLLGADADTMIAKPSAVGRGPVLDLRTSEVRDPGADEVIAERYADDLRWFEACHWDPAEHDWSAR